jgi:hypothetical protein
LTDITSVKAIANPNWRVPAHSGLAAEALVGALRLRGPSRSRELVALGLRSTDYDAHNKGVVGYEGVAAVVELDISIPQSSYSVAAVGPNVIPITTPPVFDQLLQTEIEHILLLRGKKNSHGRQINKIAKRLFSKYCALPVLDLAMKEIAKLKRFERKEPGPCVSNTNRWGRTSI